MELYRNSSILIFYCLFITYRYCEFFAKYPFYMTLFYNRNWSLFRKDSSIILSMSVIVFFVKKDIKLSILILLCIRWPKKQVDIFFFSRNVFVHNVEFGVIRKSCSLK